MVQLAAAPAPAGFDEVRSWPLGDVDELASIRHDLGKALRDGLCAGSDDVPDAVLLVVSELATNAVEHGRGPALLRLCAHDGEILLEVADRAPDLEPELAAGEPSSSGGFGLMLATRLADDVGWHRTATGKLVWARFTARTPHSAQPAEPALAG